MKIFIPILAMGAHYASAIALPEVQDGPGGLPSKRQMVEPTSKVPGAKRVKIRTGPYKVPNMQTSAGPYRDHGTIWNLPQTGIEKPCSGECTLLSQTAGLEYPNGTIANIDSGMWLHHMVGFIQGPTRWDPTCYNWPSGPHLAVMSTPNNAERNFASGNERSFIDYNPPNSGFPGTGYHITEKDKFAYLVDLMNMNMDDRNVYVTMTYDYIEGPLPQGWSEVKTVWLDAFECGTSEIAPPKQSGTFVVSSKPWKPNLEGKLIGAMGHLHDGGVEISTTASPGVAMCEQSVAYGETPAYKFTGTMDMGTDKPAVNHISSMGPCKVQPVKEMKKDQSWTVDAKYDYDKAPGNIENGKQSNVMAISLVLVAVPPGGAKPPGGLFGKQ